MTTIAIETLNAWSATWFALMGRSLIEGTAALVLIGALYLLARRRVSAAAAHVLFVIVLLKTTIPVGWPLNVPTASSSPPAAPISKLGQSLATEPAPIETSPTPPAAMGAAVEFPVTGDSMNPPAVPVAALGRPRVLARTYLMLAWGVVVTGLLARLAGANFRMAQRLRLATRVDLQALPVDIATLSEIAGVRGPVAVLESPWVDSPAVWGFLRPRILIPPGFARMLSSEQLTWALFHELAHVRRGDVAIAWLQRLAQSVYFFHPAVWVANRAVDVFREFACDDEALGLAGIARHDCGAGFLAIAEHSRGAPHTAALSSLGLFGSFRLILTRLERILDDRRALSPRLSRRATASLIVAVLAVIPSVRAQAPREVPANPPGGKPSARTLTVTVVDRRTGKPLSEVAIEATVDEQKRNGQTDAAGRFVLELPRAEPAAVSIRLRKPGFVPGMISWGSRFDVPTRTPEAYTCNLEEATSIGGLIQDQEGRPIAGATVFVLVPSRPATRDSLRTLIWDEPNRTDAQGRWECKLVPAELPEVWLRLAHTDYLSDTNYNATPQPPMAKLRDGTGVMTMRKGLPVEGIVRDRSGAAVAGATVALGGERPGGDFPSAVTDANGRFRFAHVAPGDAVLSVQAKGSAPELKELKVVANLPAVEFQLGAPHSLRGRIVDEEGKPIAGAGVAADEWRQHRSLEIRGESDAEGKFRVDDLPSDQVAFQFYKEGFMNLPYQWLKPTDDEQVITMRRPLLISGKVTDAATGQPINDFLLIPGDDPGRDPTRWERGDARRLHGGEYQIRFTWPYPQIRGLRVEADGYLPAVSRGFHFSGGRQFHDFQLRRGTVPTRPALAGLVLLPDGAPAQGAEVALATKTLGLSIQNGKLLYPEKHPTAHTNASGAFTFAPQTEAAVIVVAHDRGFAMLGEDELLTMPAHAIKLEPWGRIEGTLWIGSRLAGDELVRLDSRSQRRDERESIFIHSGTHTDAKGKFVFERVVPGRASIARGIKSGRHQIVFGYWMPVVVKAGETARVNLGGIGRPVIGRVTKPAGAEDRIDWSRAFAHLSLEPPPVTQPQNMNKEQRAAWYAKWILTDEGKAYLAYQNDRRSYGFVLEVDGSFRIDDVLPGSYILSITANDADRKMIGNATRKVVVLGAPDLRSDVPLDLGTFEFASSL